jgi:hypothetical protein
MWEKLGGYWKNHGTKVLGFGQVTLGAVAANAGDFFSRRALQLVIMLTGLLTAWRGFANSKNNDP